ncbi:MAG: Uracil-DNA glycosylase [Chlamydiae bacterium]|nr:Uracil-DNA glycosylase [Chlamydiota bacterium]
MTLPPPQLEESWKEALSEEWKKPYLQDLAAFVAEERMKFSVYPPKNEVFSAFEHTSYDKVKVVIVGQDPYHGPGQAHGLCFSVRPAVPLPPSLKNVYTELHEDLGLLPPHGCLLSWTKQGVLLLNAVLTVREHEPRSHNGKGWEKFTDAVVAALIAREEPLVFLLWGKAAQEKCRHFLDEKSGRHTILMAPHPSPFSARSGFFGSRPFSKINNLLKTQGKEPIDWAVK